MKNDYYKKLLKWKTKGLGYPLVMIGSRFVGKTTLAKEFGKNEFKNVIYINFEEMKEINELFDNSVNLDSLLNKTAKLLGFFELNIENTLFILDEVQSSPFVMKLTKFVYDKIPPCYLIIIGSDMGHSLETDISLFENKIYFLKIRPISFDTYLSIIDPILYEGYNNISNDNNLDKLLHHQLVEELLNYLIIGGMPECVYSWKKYKNLNKILTIQSNLIIKLKESFIKIAKQYDVLKIINIFENIPIQLENKIKKFKYSNLDLKARSREYENSINWLISASIISKLYQTKENQKKLENFVNNKNFRLYLSDVGILKSLLNINNETILLNKEFIYKKSLIENFCFEQLKTIFKSNEFFYFSFNRFELDFILEYNNKIIPIDVKYSNLKTKTSLNNYIRKWKPELAIIYWFGYFKVENKIIYIPFFLINKTKEIIDGYFKN